MISLVFHYNHLTVIGHIFRRLIDVNSESIFTGEMQANCPVERKAEPCVWQGSIDTDYMIYLLAYIFRIVVAGLFLCEIQYPAI